MVHLLLSLSLSFCTPSRPVVPDASLQLVVGVTDAWNSREATLYRFERKPGKRWKRVGSAWRANIGKNGLAAGRGLLDWCGPDSDRKIEGDKKAPAGAFRLGGIYGWGQGLKNAPRGRMRRLGPTAACVSDPDSKSYNRIVDTDKVDNDWDWAGLFHRGHNEVKDRTIVIGVNGAADPDDDPPLPNQGSCVLFHVSRGRGHPTVGCTSLPAGQIDRLIAWLRPSSEPVYVLMTRDQYRDLAADPHSGLPRIR